MIDVLAHVPILLALGLVAGTLGGLLGIGGSIVMIPVLSLLLHYNQHLAQAAAMIVNFFVAVPALMQHQRAGAVNWTVVRRMLPAGIAMILVGVLVSNQLDHDALMRVFGVFLVYVIFQNVRRLLDRHGPENLAPRVGWVRSSVVGSITAFAGGLLGIGGGVLTVPLVQRINHLPLRTCIAVSAAAMCVTSPVGAIGKNLALAPLGLDPYQSLVLAACLVPTAIVGGHLGARLTHALPVRAVRAAFVVLVIVAAARFLTVGMDLPWR